MYSIASRGPILHSLLAIAAILGRDDCPTTQAAGSVRRESSFFCKSPIGVAQHLAVRRREIMGSQNLTRSEN